MNYSERKIVLAWPLKRKVKKNLERKSMKELKVVLKQICVGEHGLEAIRKSTLTIGGSLAAAMCNVSIGKTCR